MAEVLGFKHDEVLTLGRAVGGLNSYFRGVPRGGSSLLCGWDRLMRRLVLRNQVVVGSVNAGRKHFQTEVEDLERVQRSWGNALQRVVTHRFPYQRFAEAIELHSPEEIKTVVEWES
jgi:glucose 1-dehydrogenase